jgi:hypothetical protein
MDRVKTTGNKSVLCRCLILCDLQLRWVLAAGLLLGGFPAPLWSAEPPAIRVEDSPEAHAGSVARQAVADALGIESDGVRVVSTVFREFPDGSLGCPQPGMAYGQVISPGYQVLVEAGGRRFDVRVAGTGGRICYRRKTNNPPDKAGAGGTTPPSAEIARQDLALRLRLPATEIRITGQRVLRPGEALDGCGIVCAADAPPGTCGTNVRLHAGDRDYDYLLQAGTVRPCPDIAAR